MGARGFILQPTYRIESGRPVIHLYGRLENGETFLVRDDREIPHFYVDADKAEAAAELGATVRPSERRNMRGTPVARVDVRVPPDAPPLRDRLTERGITCYEADVRFAMSYLISRGIRAILEIDGEWRPAQGIDRLYVNPNVGALDPGAEISTELSVLSFDIETDPRARRLLSIGLYGCGASEVLLFCPEGYSVPAGAVPFHKERALLRGFCRRVRELDPDILTGWNVVDFDCRVLERMARKWRLPLDLGRGPGTLRLRPTRFPWASNEATVPGRVVLDGIHLLRSSFVSLESYSLDNASRTLLGEGKTLQGHDRAGQILETFKHDRERFVDYNLTDARLVIEILDKLKMIDLTVARSRLTGLPVDRVAGSIAAFDFLYMSELHKRGIVAPTVDSRGPSTSNLGGHILDPESGLYENVLVFDFKSLYPSLIRTFQIDPLGYLPDPRRAEEPPIVAPNKAAFRRDPGILTLLLDELFPAREAAKAEDDKVKSHAIKILMNSFYGVLGTQVCRFHRPQLATAITSFGRDILRWSKKCFEDYGYRVIYGDTDSVFVLSGLEDPDLAWNLGHDLVARFDRDLTRHLKATWQVESRLELELEKLYLKLHLPHMRHGRGGARKRYAGLLRDGEVDFVGMEVVRRDWTELAKRVQRELYQRLFHQEELASYLDLVVSNLRAGRLDEHLVYSKGLGKKLDEYTSTTPPHVAAARKLSRRPGRRIRYLMTRDGAEPVEELRGTIDYEHYVQKQVRPVAEPVLEILGLDFDKVIGDDGQLELF